MIAAAALLLALIGCLIMLASILVERRWDAYGLHRAGRAACILAMGLLLISGVGSPS